MFHQTRRLNRDRRRRVERIANNLEQARSHRDNNLVAILKPTDDLENTRLDAPDREDELVVHAVQRYADRRAHGKHVCGIRGTQRPEKHSDKRGVRAAAVAPLGQQDRAQCERDVVSRFEQNETRLRGLGRFQVDALAWNQRITNDVLGRVIQVEVNPEHERRAGKSAAPLVDARKLDAIDGLRARYGRHVVRQYTNKGEVNYVGVSDETKRHVRPRPALVPHAGSSGTGQVEQRRAARNVAAGTRRI